jgi:CMP/dCMP kinase
LIFDRRPRLCTRQQSRERLSPVKEAVVIVTIDGPAGAGKSTAARALAKRLGYDYLDTGAMYRAITLAALRRAVDTRDESALETLLTTLTLDMPPGQVLLDGEDVSAFIRTSEVTAASGPIASSTVVRHALAEQQRRIGEGRNIVCEGRDQGTVVFPDAGCKFYLLADPVERARRRLRELQAKGERVTLDDVLKAQEERDRRDAGRALAPMKPADDAILLDSTALSPEEVVEQMASHVRARSPETV